MRFRILGIIVVRPVIKVVIGKWVVFIMGIIYLGVRAISRRAFVVCGLSYKSPGQGLNLSRS